MRKYRSIPFNFGGLGAEHSGYRDSKIVILPVAFDKTSSWIKGARKGPEAIIDASRFMELYDMETGSQVYLEGIHTMETIRHRRARQLEEVVYQRISRLLTDGKFAVVLGGEHTVALGSIRAHHHFYPEVGLLHLDAHGDLRESYEGNPYSHACVMARAREYMSSIVSVGIRSMDASEAARLDSVSMIPAQEIDSSGRWMQRALNDLKSDIYVTIDLDVLDPSIMPSTGTPEPGGLTWKELMAFLQLVSKQRRIRGFDVVELCPSKNRAPDFLAAKLVYRLLSMIWYGRD